MNALVKAALNKLIGDDTQFRGELEGMIDEVNRAATDPTAVVRGVADNGVLTEAKGDPATDAPPADAPADAPPADAPAGKFSPEDLNEIANALIGNPDFIKALGDNIQGAPVAKAQAEPVVANEFTVSDKPVGTVETTKIEQMFRSFEERLEASDKQISLLAESLITNEAEASKTSRVRESLPAEGTVFGNRKLDLGRKSATVLAKMGPPRR